MRTKLAAAAALSLLCATARAGQEYRFSGEPVQDPRTGFTVIGEREQKIVAVSSPKHHYLLILPWTEDWALEAEGEALLRGNSGLVNVTLSVERFRGEPGEHLRELEKRIGARGAKGIERSELVTHRGQPVLRQLLDAAAASGRAEFRGTRMLHLFAVKRRDGVAYVLHLSRVLPAAEAERFDEKPLLNMVTLGFDADFMRDGPPPR